MLKDKQIDAPAQPKTPTVEAQPEVKPQLLLKVTASIAGARTKDGKPRKAKRYVPWATPTEFTTDPLATLLGIIVRNAAAMAAGTISGITTDGEIVSEEKYTHDGRGQTGKSEDQGTLDLARFWVFNGKGITLAQQQQMQNILFKLYGDSSKVKKNGGEEQTEEAI